MADSLTASTISHTDSGVGVGVSFVRPISVDVYSRRGRTPLMVAAAGGHTQVVKALIERGRADVNLPLAITDEEVAEMQLDGALLNT